MDALLRLGLRRFRPRIGWPLFVLLVLAALCPAMAASASKFHLPVAAFAWIGVVGLLLGLLGPVQRHGRLRCVAGFALWAALAVLFGAVFLLVVLGALPPLGIFLQDLAAGWGWLRNTFAGIQSAGTPLPRYSWAFLRESLPRSWRELLAAPNAGLAGARLILASGGAVLIWLGAIALGLGVARRRMLFAWGLPLLGAIACISILGGESIWMLVIGTGLLLLLALLFGFRSREAAWDRAGIDFSAEIWQDVSFWGGALVTVILIVAALLPAWGENPIARAIWPQVEAPSGLAELERASQPARRPVVDPGISQLPALNLGMSLEEAPPETISLLVHVAAPLPSTPWLHYWRARVFNQYTGHGWTQNARVGALDPIELHPEAVSGSILQDVEDRRANRTLVFALPEVVALSVPANVERLPDGVQSALQRRQDAVRYSVLSLPQELASPPSTEPPPDMSAYIQLPSSLPPQVAEVARSITSDQRSAYARALALERYLRTLPYSYQVQPLPSNGDAVYQFLFDMRQGYCTYYASAMAVMARSLGIPARVASGYATGSYDTASQTYTVHEADAHAWPELYIDGRWMPFEPTPVLALPARNGESAPTPAAVPQPTPVPETPRTLSGPLIWLLVVLLILGLMALGLWKPGRRASSGLVSQVQQRLERSGARAGVAWPAGATLHEYSQLLEPRIAGAADQLHMLVELIERVRYGRAALPTDDERRLRAAAQDVFAQLRRRRLP